MWRYTPQYSADIFKVSKYLKLWLRLGFFFLLQQNDNLAFPFNSQILKEIISLYKFKLSVIEEAKAMTTCHCWNCEHWLRKCKWCSSFKRHLSRKTSHWRKSLCTREMLQKCMCVNRLSMFRLFPHCNDAWIHQHLKQKLKKKYHRLLAALWC